MKKRRIKQRILKPTVIGLSMVMFAGQVTPVLAIANDLPSFDKLLADSTSQKRNVMYYGDWSVWGGQGNQYPKDLPADQLTHLNFAFMDFDSEGNLVFTDEDAAIGNPVGQTGVTWGDVNAGILPALQQLRAENPNMKIGVSLGGWSKSGDFTEVASNPKKLENLVNQVLKFIKYTNMDFVDVDWEFPGSVREPDLVDNKNDEGTPNSSPQDKELFVELLKALRNGLDKQGVELGKDYELSIALHPSMGKLDLGIDIPRVFDIVDFANIMTYDMRGAWDDNAGHQTGLYTNPNDPLAGLGLSIDESVNYLISQGAEANKIVIGAAYYTRGWEKVSTSPDSNNPGLFGKAEVVTKDADQTPSRGAKNEAPLKSGDGGRMSGIWSYRNIDKLKQEYPGLKEYWDETAKAPYLYDEKTGTFFTYDNVKSIQEKAKYVNSNDLGGMIAWMASQDKPTSTGKRDELTKATKEALFGQDDLQDFEIVYDDLDATVSIKPYAEPWGNIGGFEVTFKNNERLEESNQVLKAVEKTAETAKMPKFYIKHNLGNMSSGDYKAGTVTNENGYTIVDLSSVYDAKNLAPGVEYTFRLKTESKPTGTDGIHSVELTQRMSKDGVELNRQLVYGKDSGESQNTAPVISGISNKTIFVGDSFNALDGVKALDKEDGDITSNINVSGSVNTNKAGKYELTYSITDSKALTTTAKRVITVNEKVIEPEEPKPDSDFGVGQGIEWPAQVNAPFADMTAWNNGDFSVNGALNLKKIALETGVNFFNLGFIQATSGISDGKVNWGWGGFSSLSEKNPNDTQYQGIKQAIKDVRELGGDVTISLGGLNGTAIWEVTSDVDVLYNTYKEIVTGYGLTRLDLDIEGSHATNKNLNIANAKAIKRVQDETGVGVVLTLAVLPSGLTQVQLDVLEAYLSQGVDIELVNIMTMCYGNATLLPGENYGTASLRAVDSTKEQVKNYFKKHANIELTDAEAYRKIGTTVSVGFEGSAHPIFVKEWTELVVDHAIDRGIGMTSMWSINRDSMAQANSGIYAPYEHTNLFKKFGSDEELPAPNNAPVLSGVDDVTITIGDNFDPYNGVKAIDKEDGDITNKIVVEGTVNTEVAGKYTLTYSVTDNGGKTTIAIRVITVKAKDVVGPEEPTGDTFDINKVYYQGDVVIYKGNKYTAKWWVQGERPDESQAWEKEVKPNEDGSINYETGMIFTGGQIVKYNGKTYKAKWWTNTVPGSDESWQLID